MTVKLIPVKSEEQFVEEWNNMDNNGSNIVKVSLYFHSTPDTLIINSNEEEYMTVAENGITYKGSDGTSILKLNRKTISTICLYACNSAHQSYANNLALVFFESQDVNTVYGWDGSMRWSRFTGTPILANNQSYFESWLSAFGSSQRKPKGLVKYSRDTMPYVTYPGIWERR